MDPKLAKAFADLKTDDAAVAADPVEDQAEAVEAATAEDTEQVEAADSGTAEADPVEGDPEADKGEPGEDDTETVKVESDEKPDDAKKEGRGERRIRRLAAKKRKLEADVKERDERIAALEAQLQQRLPGKEDGRSNDSTDWMDRAAKADDMPEAEAADVSELRELVQQVRVDRERDVLRRELTDVRKDHPTVPLKVLLKAVEKDPKVDLFDVAEGWDALMGRKTAAAADADPVTTEAKPKTKALRPPKARGVAPSATNGKDKYAGMKTAREILGAYKAGLRP